MSTSDIDQLFKRFNIAKYEPGSFNRLIREIYFYFIKISGKNKDKIKYVKDMFLNKKRNRRSTFNYFDLTEFDKIEKEL
jgi:hypothetical protein